MSGSDSVGVNLSEVENNLDKVTQFISSEVAPLTELRDQRRAICEAQIRVSDVQSSMCDDIREKTPKAIHERIQQLRDSPDEHDRKFFDYIRSLMTLKYGIWCVQCNTIKKVTGRPEEEIEQDVEAEINGQTPNSHATKKIIPLSANNRTAALMDGNDAAHSRRLALLYGGSTRPAIMNSRPAEPQSEPRRMIEKQREGVARPKQSEAVDRPKAAEQSETIVPLGDLTKDIDARIASLRALHDKFSASIPQIESYIKRLEDAKKSNQAPIDDILARLMGEADDEPINGF